MLKRLGFVFLAILCAGRLTHATFAQTSDGTTAIITSPADGQQLFGMVNITGSAGHPSAFGSYTLEYDDLSDPAPQWFLVQERVTQQVQNGVLGTWNTSMVPDGVYQLRLRVILLDGQESSFIVSNLRVVNSQPTPIPTIAAGPADSTPFAVAPGLIEQPPSNNPDVQTIGGPAPVVDTAPDQSEKTTTRINVSRVRDAFCSGVYLTLVLFGLMLGYVVLRGRLRPYARRIVWQSQDEIDQN